MSYNPSIPLVTDKILQSAKQIKSNFNVINDTFSIDHAGLTKDPSIAGKHFQMTMRPQALDPATAADQIAIYNKLVATIPELFFRPANSGTPIQLTYPSVLTGIKTKPDVYFTDQYSFMAGPFVIYGGYINYTNVTNLMTVTLSPNTTLLAVFINTANAQVPLIDINFQSLNINAINIVGNTFQIDDAPNKLVDIYYTAIGI